MIIFLQESFFSTYPYSSHNELFDELIRNLINSFKYFLVSLKEENILITEINTKGEQNA
jgi:hypothetical protein